MTEKQSNPKGNKYTSVVLISVITGAFIMFLAGMTSISQPDKKNNQSIQTTDIKKQDKSEPKNGLPLKKQDIKTIALDKPETHSEHSSQSFRTNKSLASLDHDHSAHDKHSVSEVTLEPEIALAIGELTSESEEGTIVETRPDGITVVHFSNHFQAVPVATLDQDGNIHINEYFAPPSVH